MALRWLAACAVLWGIASVRVPAATTGISPGATSPFSRMWKGSEMWTFGGGKYQGQGRDWRSIPGAILTFVYSGRGALPEPRELAIPLDKPLPPGTYRLFVKNFYRGKMEASLGDVTRPLRIRRYDWTPGELFKIHRSVEKIVLRYFPSHLVADTGARQTQHYIVQGVFLTTRMNQVPIRDGQIISSVAQTMPPARPGNYVQNGSFETGLFPWGKPFGMSHVYGAGNLDSTTAAEGRFSFRMRSGQSFGIESKMYRLPVGTYTLSFYAKSDPPVTLSAILVGLSGDLQDYQPTGLGGRFKLTNRWQRYSVSAKVAARPGALYTLRFIGRQQPVGTVWLDGVQLQNGALSDWHPASKTEVGYVCDVPGHIFYPGQGSRIELLVRDVTSAAQTQVRYRVVDYWGHQVDRGTRTVKLQAGYGALPMTLYADKTGLFRATFTAGDCSSEMVYSVLPPNVHLNSRYPQGSLGADNGRFDDAQLAILKRANFNWVISKFLGRWTEATEPEEGQFQFDDSAITSADRANMTVLIQVLTVPWGLPKWLRPCCKPKGGAPWKEADKQQYLQRWARFVSALAQHYDGSVHDWEIENEPNSQFTGSEYGEILKAASEAIRRADPKATIVGMSGGGYRKDFYEQAIQTAGLDSFDVFSVHFYGNSIPWMTRFATDMPLHYGKPAWNTETGGSCPTFYTAFPSFETLLNSGEKAAVERELHADTVRKVQNYLLTRSVGGMERYFYYFARFANAGPSRPNGKFELMEFDGSLRGTAVGLSIASHFFDQATYYGPLDLDPDLEMYLFHKGNGSVGCCWARNEKSLRFEHCPADVTFDDIMGNPCNDRVLVVNDSPVYFTCPQGPKACRALLKSMTIRRQSAASSEK